MLIVTVAGAGGGLALWKAAAMQQANARAATQPEPMEAVTAAIAQPRQYRPTTTAVGTVLALQSITLRNELAGTVKQAALTPGAIVEPGTVLVAIDVSVEEAELAANRAQAAFAQIEFERIQRLMDGQAAADIELERARAERDVALANVERVRAVIARKTIVAPFRARVGMADVHVGQYLEQGTLLTTLQGVDDAVHVDFTVAQQVAGGLREGDSVEVFVDDRPAAIVAELVAIDARVDPTTRNAWVRAKISAVDDGPAPGAAVRVLVPTGPPRTVVAVPVSAVRKGPGGDHVFLITSDENGMPRAHVRGVESGAMVGDEILILRGLEAGEQVAATGSFKLREAVLVGVRGSATANRAN